ncbi:rhs family protein [Anopheles sinensis]|uniref:Rhs family protein n=1 Tax=Anopheles sinensis TaxID=74873 RepID=A0A084VEY1_ANOSI|nr:rhs family protein [Anopheles sinensis]
MASSVPKESLASPSRSAVICFVFLWIAEKSRQSVERSSRHERTDIIYCDSRTLPWDVREAAGDARIFGQRDHLTPPLTHVHWRQTALEGNTQAGISNGRAAG